MVGDAFARMKEFSERAKKRKKQLLIFRRICEALLNHDTMRPFSLLYTHCENARNFILATLTVRFSFSNSLRTHWIPKKVVEEDRKSTEKKLQNQ